MKELKVFGGFFRRDDRVIVAATSQRQAAEIIGTSVGVIKKYFAITGNAKEIEKAISSPGTVFVLKNNNDVNGEYVERDKK